MANHASAVVWPPKLTGKQEKLRAHHGLYAGKDGWYKSVRNRKAYIARRIPLEDVVQILPHRIDELTGKTALRASVVATGSTTIKELAEMFMAHLWQRVQTGQPRKLSRRTYGDYQKVLPKFLAAVGPNQPAIGANPTWFSAFARRIAHLAPTTRNRFQIYVTAFFNWAGPGRHSLNFYKQAVIFGPDFVKPESSVMMSSLAKYSTNYTPEQFKAALDAVAPSPQLYAIGLLALNAAFIPVDVVDFTLSSLDQATGVHEFPRGKNGNPRKCVLMPETLAAIKRYIDVERRPADPHEDRLFLRNDGRPWNDGVDPNDREGNMIAANAIARYWSTCTGHPLKGLRTTFRTAADATVDRQALDLIMGHGKTNTGDKFYVKQFAVERLAAVLSPVWQRYADQMFPPDVATLSAFQLKYRFAKARKLASETPGSAAKPHRKSASVAASRRASDNRSLPADAS